MFKKASKFFVSMVVVIVSIVMLSACNASQPIDGAYEDIWITSLAGETLISLTNTPNLSETHPDWQP